MPTVTIVFLVFNRREELRISLSQMLDASDYERESVDVVVVDNASQDGSADMVAELYPDVRLVRRDVNCGVSGWNDGFAVARGDWVLVLDDDCYLPPDGLRRAVEAGESRSADMVSFSVKSQQRPEFRFTDVWIPGLLAFWGCAVLIRREALEDLGGFEPEIFVWGHELEFAMRFFDAGYRHLHFHEVTAIHMKDPGGEDRPVHESQPDYPINARHFAYIAGKLMHPREAASAFVALFSRALIQGLGFNTLALRALAPTVRGFVHGLRNRDPVRNAEISHVYRENFHTFASPWWFMRPLPDIARALPARVLGRVTGRKPTERPGWKTRYYLKRPEYYPAEAAVLEFS